MVVGVEALNVDPVKMINRATFNYALPLTVSEEIVNYVTQRKMPSDAIYWLLANNLVRSFARTGMVETEVLRIQKILNFLMNEVPDECWGDETKVLRWLGSAGELQEANRA